MNAHIYKILTAGQWAAMQAAGRFEGSPADEADGFIHLSAADQVDGTATKHFAGQVGLMLLAFDPAALGPALKWETARGGALFPHLYASLPLASVAEVRPLN